MDRVNPRPAEAPDRRTHRQQSARRGNGFSVCVTAEGPCVGASVRRVALCVFLGEADAVVVPVIE